MTKLYYWIDRLWVWVSETVFVRFDFDLPAEALRAQTQNGTLIFALVDGGLLDWFILSSWCRSQGLGPIQIANRKRILFFSKPAAFLKVLFQRSRYADLFLSSSPGPRLICFSGRERKRINVPTPTEALLAEVHAAALAKGVLAGVCLVPVFILWRRHMRGGARQLSEYLWGLSSKPTVIGKLWYLFRRREDSSVKSLGFLPLASKEQLEKLEGFDETESMRAGKSARRKVLVSVQQEMRVLLGPRYHSPSLIKETVLRSPEVQELITLLAAEQGVDRKKLLSRAYQNLTEIVADYHFRFIEVMYVLLTWLFSKVFDGLHAKEDQWQSVRELMKTKPVVFVPCHRSHLDYLIIPYLLFVHNMVTPHIAAGINLSFWPVGRFLRKGGAFFIRRSFRGDKLYQTVLTKYVHSLLQHRYNVKFFIEGTRSRSGKMLAPAYGMLKMVLETYENRVCEDVALIPVSICYDEVPEQGTYSKELGGGQKVKESAIELLRSRKIVRRRFGKVYVRMARPIFAKDLYQMPESDPRRRLQKAAFQICKSICDVTPITPISIVSTVLLCHRSPLMTLEEILRLSLELARYVSVSGMELSVSDPQLLRLSIEQVLRRLRKQGVLMQIDNVPRRYGCDARKRPLLSFYKNNAIHCFVLPSVALLAHFRAWHLHHPASGSEFDRIFKDQALALRDVLKFEFFFNPRAEFLEELDRTKAFFFGGAPVAIPSDLSVFSRVVGELLESYLSFVDFVQSAPDKSWEKKSLLSRVYRFAEMQYQQGSLLFPESLSLVNYGNALLYLENQNILRIDKQEEKTMVHLNSEESRTGSVYHFLMECRDLLQEKEETFSSGGAGC